MAPSIRQTLHDRADQLKRFSAIVASGPRGHPLRLSPADHRNRDARRQRSNVSKNAISSPCWPVGQLITDELPLWRPHGCLHALGAETIRRSHIGTTRPGTEAIPDRTVGALCPDMPEHARTCPTCQDIRCRRKSDGKNCLNPPETKRVDANGRRGVDGLAQHGMHANFQVRFVITGLCLVNCEHGAPLMVDSFRPRF